MLTPRPSKPHGERQSHNSQWKLLLLLLLRLPARATQRALVLQFNRCSEKSKGVLRRHARRPRRGKKGSPTTRSATAAAARASPTPQPSHEETNKQKRRREQTRGLPAGQRAGEGGRESSSSAVTSTHVGPAETAPWGREGKGGATQPRTSPSRERRSARRAPGAAGSAHMQMLVILDAARHPTQNNTPNAHLTKVTC